MSRRFAELARRWWSGELGAAGTALHIALAPIEAAYRLVTGLRNRAYDSGMLSTAAARVPVISIGNIAVGGTGKTPFTSWLAVRLEARGQRPAIVHGGYAADEPALHRAWTPHIPVFVDRDRIRAVQQAEAAGAGVVLLDDAYQHRRLRRDLDIVLVSVERWSAVGRLLPRGPWREPPAALVRAGLIVCVRKTPAVEASASLAASLSAITNRPIVRAHLRPATWQRGGVPAEAPSGPALLVAGLADPTLFSANVRAAGIAVTTEMMFPDHHEYSAADIERVREAAHGRAIVTSAKDWIRLSGRLDPAQTWVLTQELVLEEGEALLDEALERVLR
jgi:tetraacyldisaccharide 4'-kinase